MCTYISTYTYIYIYTHIYTPTRLRSTPVPTRLRAQSISPCSNQNFSKVSSPQYSLYKKHVNLIFEKFQYCAQ